MSNYICDCGQHYMSLAAVDACQAGHNGTLPCRECERKDQRIAELEQIKDEQIQKAAEKLGKNGEGFKIREYDSFRTRYLTADDLRAAFRENSVPDGTQPEEVKP